MADVERRDGGDEKEKLMMKGDQMVLDFDLLCSTVAMQAHKGGWSKLYVGKEDENLVFECDEYERGVFKMWEGELVYDCFDDRRIAIQSTCCPCYRFGKNMKRAGFGSSFLQGLIYLILVMISVSSLVAFVITGRRCLLYLAIVFAVSAAVFVGCYRTQIRKKFKIQGSESSLDDCVYHLICPCCTLSQESRTLEMNNVQDGIWHGRGDTICIGSFPQDTKTLSEINPNFFVSTNSPEFLAMQKTSNR